MGSTSEGVRIRYGGVTRLAGVGAVGNRDVVLIVSSDASARQLAGVRFKQAGFATAELETGHDALATASSEEPAIVILDLDLDDMTGYMACRELRDQLGEEVPIILVSGERTESSDAVAGLLIGADDYVTKPFDPDELLVRAQRLMSKRPGSLPWPTCRSRVARSRSCSSSATA